MSPGPQREKRSVSPVIGAVLMIAVTVVLAATAAAFVFGFGDRINTTAPQAGFSTKYTDSPGGSTDSWGHSYGGDFDNDGTNEAGELDVEFTSGEGIDAERVSVSYPGGTNETTAGTDIDSNGDGELDAGDSLRLAVAPGDTVRVVWTAPGGGRTATLTAVDVPG
ncbi:MAG: flagellin-like protein [Salinirussus sp.]|jgi:flagellin-like protein